MTASRRPALIGLLAVALLVAAGCGSGPKAASDPSAKYFSSTPQRTVAPTPSAVPTGAPLAAAASGPVARPDPNLTPGVVGMIDVNAVCQQDSRVRAQIPFATQVQVYAEYGIPYSASANYGLDYLIPLQIGGAAVPANLWAAPINGIGFHQKEQLNFKLRAVVCQGQLPLAQAQQQVASDWYSVWLKYAAS